MTRQQLPLALGVTASRREVPATLRELEIRAQALHGRSVGELAAALGVALPTDARRSKGYVGQLVERALGADPTAADRPDFLALGVELKTIPVDDRGVPVESTFCCSIRMDQADVATWQHSRLRARLARVLWVPVQGKRVAPLAQRRFLMPQLWTPSKDQEEALRCDWEDLMGAIGAGRAGSLSAHEGAVLQVRPKAAKASVRTLAPGVDGPQMALPLGFYLRPRFTAEILQGHSLLDRR